MACNLAQAAQHYRWFDDKGRVEWHATPPPSGAKKVKRHDVQGSFIETSSAPYSVQQATRNFLLTLYILDCGETCIKARSHLTRRGIPFTVKNPQDDVEAYKKLTNFSIEAPMLLIGQEQLKGYEQDSWNTALYSAGYSRIVAVARPAPSAPAQKPNAKPVPTPPEAKLANTPAGSPASQTR